MQVAGNRYISFDIISSVITLIGNTPCGGCGGGGGWGVVKGKGNIEQVHRRRKIRKEKNENNSISVLHHLPQD